MANVQSVTPLMEWWAAQPLLSEKEHSFPDTVATLSQEILWLQRSIEDCGAMAASGETENLAVAWAQLREDAGNARRAAEEALRYQQEAQDD